MMAKTMILVILGHSLRPSKTLLRPQHLKRITPKTTPKSSKAHLASTPPEITRNSSGMDRKSIDRSQPTRPSGTAASAFKFNPKRPVSLPPLRISSIRMRTRASCCRRMVAATPAPAAQTAGSTLASCAPMERATRAGGGSRAPMKGIARADAQWHSSSDAASTISLRAAIGLAFVVACVRRAGSWRWRFPMEGVNARARLQSLHLRSLFLFLLSAVAHHPPADGYRSPPEEETTTSSTPRPVLAHMVKRDRRVTIIDDGSLPVVQEYINKGTKAAGTPAFESFGSGATFLATHTNSGEPTCRKQGLHGRPALTNRLVRSANVGWSSGQPGA